MIFRIPTPTFGLGLIEQIPDCAIDANARADCAAKPASASADARTGILPTGTPNRNGNDGTIARFGWKAQNKSLLLFSGEAYNVEMGITNELFQSERDETPACQFAPTPNDVTDTDADTPLEALSAHREVRRSSCASWRRPRRRPPGRVLRPRIASGPRSCSRRSAAPSATRRRCRRATRPWPR